MSTTSTKPKGATSYKETAFGILSRKKLLQREIEGTKKGLDFISGLINKNKQIAITSELLYTLHDVSFGWIFPDWAGKYRKIQVTLSGKEAPLYFQVPELMAALCKDLSERLKHVPAAKNENFILEVVRLLAWFQHRFVFIHPFQDYNGRTARMLTQLLLLKFDLPAVEIQVETIGQRKQYIQALQTGDDGDLSKLEDILNQTLTEGLEQFISNKSK